MRWKGLILLFILIGLGTVALVYFAVGRPIQYTSFKADNLVSLVPDWNATRYKNKNWKGWVFRKGASVFRVLWERPSDPEEAYKYLLTTLDGYTYRFDVPLYDGGRYVLKKYRKGFKVVVVFRHGEKIYWIDETTNSTLRKYKRAVDIFLLNLKLDGKGISTRARETILTSDRRLPITFIQPGRQIMAIVVGIFVLIILGMIVGFKYFGACPMVPDAIVCSPMSIIRTKNMFEIQYSTCCVCLGSEYVSVYSRKRLIFEIPLAELYKNYDFLAKGKLNYGNYSVTISNFHRWKQYLPPPTL